MDGMEVELASRSVISGHSLEGSLGLKSFRWNTVELSGFVWLLDSDWGDGSMAHQTGAAK